MPHLSPGQILRQAATHAFLITDPVNIGYLTGLPVSSGVVLVVPRKMILFVDARYSEMAERSCQACAVADIATLPDALAQIRRCGFEAEHVTVQRRERWSRSFPRTTFRATVGVLQEFRRQKTEDELRLLKRARRMTREVLRRVPSTLRSGITEQGLARKLLSWALELGADGLSFDPIVAFGTHTACPHHHPTTRVLQKGHIVQIDVGVKYRGYCADMSEVFFTAEPTTAQAQVYHVLCVAKDRAAAAARAGASTRHLDSIARGVLAKAGIEQYFTHALGHGVGLEIHEGVSLSAKAPDRRLLQNEVITIEPGVYIPGKYGMRVEDMFFVQ